MIIDHIGYVVSDIATSLKCFTDVYGFNQQSGILIDDTQRVKLVMLSSDNSYKIELIQPIHENSPSYDFMKKGGGFHHFCYSVENLVKAINSMRSSGHLLIKRPVSAPLLNERPVAFLFSKVDKQVIELVEGIEV